MDDRVKEPLHRQAFCHPALRLLLKRWGGGAGGSRVVQHGVLYVVGTVFQRGLGLLLLPFVTRVLGVEEFGLAATAAAVAALLAIVYGLGINFSIVRFFYDDPQDAARARWAALLRVQFLIAAGLAVVTYATGPLWASLFKDFGWNAALQASVLYGFALASQTTTQGVLRAARRPVAFVVTSLMQVGIGGGLGIVHASSHGASGYVLGLTIGSLIATATALFVTYRVPEWRRDTVTGGIRLGLPFMVHSLANWGLDLSTRLLVAGYLGLAAVGRYQVAFVVGSALTLVLTSIQAAFAPFYIGELSASERRITPPLLMLPVTTVAMCATILLVLLGPALLGVVAPAEFGGAELVVGLAAAGTLARAPYFVGAAVLLDQKRSGSLARGSLSGAVLSVALSVILIQAIGVEGAAIATIAGIMVQATVVLRDVGRRLGESMRLSVLLCVWVGGAGALAAVTQLPEEGVGLAVRILLGLVFLGGTVLSIRWLRDTFAAARRAAADVAGPEPEHPRPVS
jgi:O-antigen/teichoic acid export membrane protein